MRATPPSANRPHTARVTPPSQRGAALIWALLFSLIVSGMIISHSTFLAANRRQSDVRFHRQPLSDTYARAGLTDALSWFRRQSTQPVVSFAPQRDPSGDPPLLDTLDPSVGLVREFEVRGGLWGRYEVRKDEASDISAQRGVIQAGSVWELAGRGIVYQRLDPSRPCGVAPNRILSITSLKSELRGVPLLPPAQAAVIVEERNDLVLDNGARVDGSGHPAIVYRTPLDLLAGLIDPDHDAADDLLPLAVVLGVPAELNLPTLDTTPRTWAAMSLDDLRSLADFVVPGGVVRQTVRDGSVVFVGGDLTVDDATSLRGRMLLVVQGDLKFAPGNGSDFEGFVYAGGDIVVKGPVRFRGTVMGRQLVKIYAGADLAYDQTVMQSLQSELARYRLSRKVREGDN